MRGGPGSGDLEEREGDSEGCVGASELVLGYPVLAAWMEGS